MGQITIEIPQSVNRNYQINSEKFLTKLEHLVEEDNENGKNLNLGFADKVETNTRVLRMNWLKANREKYAGQYVALNGDKLVGKGKTIREAHEQAKQNGIEKPFLVRVSSENEILSGGW